MPIYVATLLGFKQHMFNTAPIKNQIANIASYLKYTPWFIPTFDLGG